ncbi:MAG: hypothetical protein NC218_10355, partial [Acetobacter sp.]|nr:hypothetical protein [Acetobacter sp.]
MFEIKYKELKQASTKSALYFYFSAFKGYRWIFIFDIVYSFLLSLSKIWVMVIFAKLIDYFSSVSLQEFSWGKAMLYVGGIFGVFLMTNSVRFIRETISEKVRSMVSWRAQEYALIYASKHSSIYLKKQKSGQLAQRIRNLGLNFWGLTLSFARITSCMWLILIPLF